MRSIHPLLLSAVAAFVAASPAGAQITQVSRTPIQDAAQLTFGHLCGDRFVVRNDGTQAVEVEYAIARKGEHTKLLLNAREAVELASPSKDDVELWLNGKRIARAKKERRSCDDVPSSEAVVRPLENGSAADDARAVGRAGWPYGYGFADAWGYSPFYRTAFGWSPFYSGIYAYPLIVRTPAGGAVRGGRGGGRR